MANPARTLQSFVGQTMALVMKPVDLLNQGVAGLTQGVSQALPSFPAARLFRDLVLGWPHSHPHPPSMGFPLPSIGPVICAGATNVLINGWPAARSGDVGFGAWCGGYYPLFEVLTGSSHVFIGGSRAARQFIDFTRHCVPALPGIKGLKAARQGLTKFDKAMIGFTGAMGALGMGAALADQNHAEAAAENAESESEAEAAAAEAEAAGLEAKMSAMQAAADMAAMALSIGMGKDPGATPLNCFGNFITGSPNVIVGGFPMPGWMTIARGMGKLLKRSARRLQLLLPEGSRLRNDLCVITGHPVDVASGRVFTAQTDFDLPGRVPIDFTRAYDTSAIDYAGPLGRGWIHSYDIHLWEDDRQGMVILRNDEARLVAFERIEVGESAFNPLEKQWLERLGDRIYLVRGRNGTRYKFEPAGTLDSVNGIGSDPPGKAENAALRLTEIEDRNSNRIALAYEKGRLSRLEDQAGTRLKFTYITLADGAERLAGVHLALNEDSTRTARLVSFTYDAAGRLVNATDRGLVPWRYAYDDHLLIRETNRNGLSFHFAYRGEGQAARCIHTWGDDGIYERWLDYDPEARMTEVEDSLGRRTTYYFNELDLPISIVDALGGVRQYGYDANGDLLSETDEIGRSVKYSYNLTGDCTAITNSDGTTRRIDYTRESWPEKLIDETGAEFKREYDERGNITATVDALGNRREYRYNQFGDMEEAVDPLGGVMRFKWNERGRILEFSTPLGSTTRYGFDERNRLATIRNPSGYITRYAYDAQDRLMQSERPDGTRHHYRYDPEGNLTHFLDANGAETRFRYVDYNKLGERIDALGYTQRFAYDTEANLIEIHNERGDVNQFLYDELDRVQREIGFDGLIWDYDYDPASQLIARTDPAGRLTRFIRDRQGRLIERHRPDGTTITFAYDSIGRLVRAVAPDSELIFRRDPLGRVTWEAQNGKVIEHEYDALGHRIKRRSPSGQTVEFSYTADSQLDRLQTPCGSIAFEYDRSGRLTKQRFPGELEESFYYDRCGRLSEQSLYKSSHTLFIRGYKYDVEDNLVELNDSNKGVIHFDYDPVERLSEVVQPEKRGEQLVYDSTGNLLQRGDRYFRYDIQNRLVQTADTVMIYDEVGNLIENRRAGSSIHYSYDPDNRLIAIESGEWGLIEFSYDAFGRRIAKNTKDGETGFLWDGDVLLMEQQGKRSNEYAFDPESHEPLCRFDGDRFDAYHNDHLGTPRELTDERGNIVWSASYDVYGRQISLYKDKSENQIRFQGQYEDVETGLFYNFHRYYDAETGRYISRDPIGSLGGLNHYTYTQNPVNWIDPFGLAATWNCKRVRWKDSKGRFAKAPANPDLFNYRTITPAELAEVQAIANKYNTTIDIVGSRAKGEGREIHFPEKPVGKDLNRKGETRSDIDFRVDTKHPQANDIIEELKKVSNGAGTAGVKWSTSDRSTYPPYIKVSPD
ncbi:MAG TPA: RHS repeat-associated core domain-containing protein [Blastocatellia bacterium]|nr:RHS repeat-associated core domain-containing protein [Blastocatellia bacterium]